MLNAIFVAFRVILAAAILLIAAQLIFEIVTSFHRRFHAVYGCTPQQIAANVNCR